MAHYSIGETIYASKNEIIQVASFNDGIYSFEHKISFRLNDCCKLYYNENTDSISWMFRENSYEVPRDMYKLIQRTLENDANYETLLDFFNPTINITNPWLDALEKNIKTKKEEDFLFSLKASISASCIPALIILIMNVM